LARLRRKLTLESVSERARVSKPTLISIEKGAPTVSIGAYVMVLFCLGLEGDLASLAADDQLGRTLQDMNLKNKGKNRG
jgi:transcriptional regulator with XRE-family HTH domain